MRETTAGVSPDLRYERETEEHIVAVQEGLGRAIAILGERTNVHDASKFLEPERSGFIAMTSDARLRDLTYGSEEYRAVLALHQPTVGHHYLVNDHHPEYHPAGVRGMSLLALLEMLCDWDAATRRMKDGSLAESLTKNQARFGYGDELADVLRSTARELGML